LAKNGAWPVFFLKNEMAALNIQGGHFVFTVRDFLQ
jgi:hypothetical protein